MKGLGRVLHESNPLVPNKKGLFGRALPTLRWIWLLWRWSHWDPEKPTFHFTTAYRWGKSVYRCHILQKGLNGNVCLGLSALSRYRLGLAWSLSKRFAPILLLFAFQSLLVQVLVQMELRPLKSCQDVEMQQAQGPNRGLVPPQLMGTYHVWMPWTGAIYYSDPVTPS